MVSTVYTNFQQPAIQAAWLNDVNTTVYGNGFLQAGTGAVARPIQDKLRENVSVEDFGLAGNWNGTTGTDDTAKLQIAINSFNGKQGNLHFADKRYRIDSAKIDFKRVQLIGAGPTDNGATGGTELYLGSVGGLYTTIEDNTGPRHAHLRLTSSSTRTANGQICMDLTGINYPALTDVTIFGGEEGLRIKNGAVVESHYGFFDNVSLSRCYKGLSVRGGNATQTHSFFGGRYWDCVESYVNEEGTADIKFYGTAFEGDRAAQHLNAGATPQAAETKWFSCRDECNVSPDIPVGRMVYSGDYWSGYKKAREFNVVAGAVVEAGGILTSGVRGDMSPAGINILRNPDLNPDPNNDNVVPGWTLPSAATFTHLRGSRGRMLQWTRAAAFQGFEQFGLNLKKGWYTVGFIIDKENSTANGIIQCQLTTAGGVILTQGVDVDVNFAAAPFSPASGNFRGAQVVLEFQALTDLTNVRFRAAINSMPAGQVGYFGSPFLVPGRCAYVFQNTRQAPEDVVYGTAPPAAGTWRVGATVINTVPTSGGFIGWVCTTAGTPGTWKTYGAIS